MSPLSEPQYPDAKRKTTFREGAEYMDRICLAMGRQHGIYIQNLFSKKYQFTIGENVQRIEIKLDERSADTNRLSIEIAEMSAANNAAFVPSGILSRVRSSLYVQGHWQKAWMFSTKWLVRWLEGQRRDPVRIYESGGDIRGHKLVGSWPLPNPSPPPMGGTVRKFYMSVEDAERFSILDIHMEDD